MHSYFIVTVIVFATVAADYLLKLAADRSDSFAASTFWIGALLYAITAGGWMLAMKHLPLATIGVYYSVLTLLLLTFLGVVVFKETLTLREAFGIAFALASISLMTKFH